MTPADTPIALASFCVVASITPGPNNMMLLSSGATFGLRRTIPHMLGISLGCGVMVLVLGWALAAIVAQTPSLFIALHIFSTCYLLWLAWRIATSTGPHEGKRGAQPLGVLNAAAFQWVNPKAWAMVLGAVASFARPDHILRDVPVIASVLVAIGLPCIGLWAGSGTVLKSFLARPGALRLFNLSMAAALVASIVPGAWQAVAAV